MSEKERRHNVLNRKFRIGFRGQRGRILVTTQRAQEVGSRKRFAFGKNWNGFLNRIDEDRVAGTVTSFDYNPDSVACTVELRRRFRYGDPAWNAAQGSVLDSEFLRGLGTFDIVYSWGVLHHTGAMWQAMENAVGSVAPNGTLILAIYNDQGWVSDYWRFVKRAYSLRWLRPLILGIHAPYLLGLRVLVRALTGRLDLSRGRSYWHDMVDWLGDYPFEVAKPDDVVCFMHRRGFVVKALRTCGSRHGCNEYVFCQGEEWGVGNWSS